LQGIDRRLNSLVVLSASPGEGAAVIAGDLALTAARDGEQTLLVDANLGQPSQTGRFGITAERGLSDALLASGAAASSQSALSAFLQPATRVQMPNLRIMPAGTGAPNPSKLLASQAMRRLMSALAGLGAQRMIVDAPPLLQVEGSGALAALADGVIVVIDPSRTREERLLRMRTMLEAKKVNVVGCVLILGTRSRGRRGNKAPRSGGAQDAQPIGSPP